MSKIKHFEQASIRSCSKEEYENIQRLENNFVLTHEVRSRWGRVKISYGVSIGVFTIKILLSVIVNFAGPHSKPLVGVNKIFVGRQSSGEA